MARRADRRRGQAGQDGERVDEALVEDAEHDIDRQDGARDQQALIGERIQESLGRAASVVESEAVGKPKAHIAANVATIEIGTAMAGMAGMKVAARRRRKTMACCGFRGHRDWVFGLRPVR